MRTKPEYIHTHTHTLLTQKKMKLNFLLKNRKTNFVTREKPIRDVYYLIIFVQWYTLGA